MINNLNNGERFETYVIAGRKNSGVICLNGHTARKVTVGDRVIIIFCRGYFEDKGIRKFKPMIVILDSENRAVRVK